MNYLLGGALLFGACGLVAKSFVRKKVIGDDDRFDMVTRDRFAAIAIGLVGGFIVGLTSVGSGTFFGLTMLFVFPLARAQGRRHRHPPRRRAALRRRLRAHHRRQRRHACGRLAADRLDPRRADRQPLLGAGCPRRCCASRSRTCSRSAASSSSTCRTSTSSSRWRSRRDERRRRCSSASSGAGVARRGERLAAGLARAAGLNSRGVAPPALDPARRRAAGRDSRRVRGHAGPEDRAEPDPRAADRQGLLAGLRLRLARGDDPVQAAEAGPRALEIVDTDGNVVRTLVPGLAPPQREGHLHLERPRRPGRVRRPGRLQAARPPDRPAPDDRPAERDAGRHDRAEDHARLGRAARGLTRRRRTRRPRRRRVQGERAGARRPARRRDAGGLHPPAAPAFDARLERPRRRQGARRRASTGCSSPPRIAPGISRRRARRSTSSCATSRSPATGSSRRRVRGSVSGSRRTRACTGSSGRGAAARHRADRSCARRVGRGATR